MLIRPTRATEIKILQNLNDEVFSDNYKYDPDLNMDWAQSEKGREYFAGILNNSEAICLIAEEKGKPAGYLAAAPKILDYRLSKYLEIENIGVSPDFRSKGIGKMLIDECFKIAKKKGFQKVYVNSYYDNARAVSFYENCGFKRIDLSLEKKI